MNILLKCLYCCDHLLLQLLMCSQLLTNGFPTPLTVQRLMRAILLNSLAYIMLVATNPNISTTTWKFNGEPIQHNSSHYAIITEYDIGPDNASQVLSKLKLSNVISSNTGAYICQCIYKPNKNSLGL